MKFPSKLILPKNPLKTRASFKRVGPKRPSTCFLLPYSDLLPIPDVPTFISHEFLRYVEIFHSHAVVIVFFFSSGKIFTICLVFEKEGGKKEQKIRKVLIWFDFILFFLGFMENWNTQLNWLSYSVCLESQIWSATKHIKIES